MGHLWRDKWTALSGPRHIISGPLSRMVIFYEMEAFVAPIRVGHGGQVDGKVSIDGSIDNKVTCDGQVDGKATFDGQVDGKVIFDGQIDGEVIFHTGGCLQKG